LGETFVQTVIVSFEVQFVNSLLFKNFLLPTIVLVVVLIVTAFAVHYANKYQKSQKYTKKTKESQQTSASFLNIIKEKQDILEKIKEKRRLFEKPLSKQSVSEIKITILSREHLETVKSSAESVYYEAARLSEALAASRSFIKFPTQGSFKSKTIKTDDAAKLKNDDSNPIDMWKRITALVNKSERMKRIEQARIAAIKEPVTNN